MAAEEWWQFSCCGQVIYRGTDEYFARFLVDVNSRKGHAVKLERGELVWTQEEFAWSGEETVVVSTESEVRHGAQA